MGKRNMSELSLCIEVYSIYHFDIKRIYLKMLIFRAIKHVSRIFRIFL
jgi:hypothetical protein